VSTDEILAGLEDAVAGGDVDALLALRPRLAAIDAALVQRVLGLAASARAVPKESGPPAPLTLEEAAARLRRSPSWLYHHWRTLGLGYRDGGRLRFRPETIDRYQQDRARRFFRAR
jgi:hypothetical protein